MKVVEIIQMRTEKDPGENKGENFIDSKRQRDRIGYWEQAIMPKSLTPKMKTRGGQKQI